MGPSLGSARSMQERIELLARTRSMQSSTDAVASASFVGYSTAIWVGERWALGPTRLMIPITSSSIIALRTINRDELVAMDKAKEHNSSFSIILGKMRKLPLYKLDSLENSTLTIKKGGKEVEEKREPSHTHQSTRGGVARVYDAAPTKVVFAIFFLLKPSLPPIYATLERKPRESPSLEAREPTRLHLSGALGAWLVSPDSVSADLHDGGIGSHHVDMDRGSWAPFSSSAATVCIIWVSRGTVAMKNHRWKKVEGKNSERLLFS
ncbi:hypothetical protein Cgig2_029629 [Carnegiea gigantea]|uniref:Uncharacterized protein n=1 Tax=Carnegiea gigantea TaxID=171969 RepID=A0A9Q1KJ02_9CARY|nr:hypothetical protein Cgig2_029629 [Carnegiea gigantea]